MLRRILAAVVLAGWAAPAGAQVRTDERVDVARVLVDVRVTDHGGGAARPGARDLPDATVQAPTGGGVPPGRLTVFMFQTVSNGRGSGACCR